MTGVHPSDLEPRDRVIVDSQHGVVTGTVERVESEAGRLCVHVKGNDGSSWACWQQEGRTFYRPGSGQEAER